MPAGFIVIANNANPVPSDLAAATPAPPMNPQNTLFWIDRSTRALRAPYSTVSGNFDHEQQGVSVPPSSAYLAFYANNAAWPSLNLNSPPCCTGTNVLDAPFVKAPSGSCIAYSMDYLGAWSGNASTSDDTTTRVLEIHDFCAGGSIAASKTVDHTFQLAYLRNLGHGVPEYTMEIYGYAGGYWSAYLYNYGSGKWERIYVSAQGTDNSYSGNGLDVFEIYPTSGPCTLLPQIMSTEMQLMYTSGSWTPVGGGNAGTYYFESGSTGPYGTCFQGTSPRYTTTYPSNPNDLTSWTVTSS
ncbi:MAG: hypothetical protein JO101_02725 [Candidatus Eremiobacteraeota bacterium]|nr:hypothetical protein [Candidatus Eremiobacteraeota bacterium]